MGDSQNSNQESIAGSIADEIDLWKTLFEPDFYTSLSDPFGTGCDSHAHTPQL
jgi:hypothetical protein